MLTLQLKKGRECMSAKVDLGFVPHAGGASPLYGSAACAWGARAAAGRGCSGTAWLTAVGASRNRWWRVTDLRRRVSHPGSESTFCY